MDTAGSTNALASPDVARASAVKLWIVCCCVPEFSWSLGMLGSVLQAAVLRQNRFGR